MAEFNPSVQKSILFVAPFFPDVHAVLLFHLLEFENRAINRLSKGFDHNMIVYFRHLSTFRIYRSPRRLEQWKWKFHSHKW